MSRYVSSSLAVPRTTWLLVHGTGGVPSLVSIHQSGQQAQSFFCLHLNRPSGVEALSILCTLVVQITVR